MRSIRRFNFSGRRRRCRRGHEHIHMRLPRVSTVPAGLLTAALALALAGTARDGNAQRARFTSDYRSRVDTTVAFDKNGSVTLTAGSGDVVVTGWARNEAHVTAVSDNENVRFDATSSRLSVELAGRSRGSDARFEVSVPYGVQVLVRTQSGDISVRGTRGEVEVHSQNGDVQIEDVMNRLDINTLSGDIRSRNVTGDVEIGTTSGEVRLADIRGNIEIGTVSGDIELRSVTAKLVRAKTTSGDVTYDGLIDPAGRYELSAHSGDIDLHVPREANAQLTVSTWNGGVNSECPITLKPGEHGIGSSNAKRFTFSIGGGAARITAETFSGDITISSNGRGAAARPYPISRPGMILTRRLLRVALVAGLSLPAVAQNRTDFKWE